KYHDLACRCICYQGFFQDGALDAKTGIHRYADHGPCGICMLQKVTCKDRLIDEMVIYQQKL
ncbi:hypothetical protein KA005_42195, partial [bacterium]|nr:hypothetical protein [bacterium]